MMLKTELSCHRFLDVRIKTEKGIEIIRREVRFDLRIQILEDDQTSQQMPVVRARWVPALKPDEQIEYMEQILIDRE
jgi:hypothetical protein